MKRTNIFLLSGVLLAAPPSHLGAAPPEGASRVIAKLEAALASDTEAGGTHPALDKKLVSLETAVKSDDAAAMATAWCDLFRQTVLLHASGGGRISGTNDTAISLALKRLPPPKAWPQIAAELEDKKSRDSQAEISAQLVRLLAPVLINQPETAWEQVLALKAPPGSENFFDSLRQQFAEVYPNPERSLSFFQSQLEQAEKAPSESYLQVPNLVALVGEEKARSLLERVIGAGVQNVSISDDSRTRALAREVALARIDKMKYPFWALAASLEAGALYDALAGKFPESDPDRDYERISAMNYRLLSLIEAGQSDRAMTLAKELNAMSTRHSGVALSLGSETLDLLLRRGHGDELLDFLSAALEKDPAMALWDNYMHVAIQLHKRDAMLEFIQKVAARPDLSEKTRTDLKGKLGDAWLSADNLERGIPALEASLKEELDRRPLEANALSAALDQAAQLVRIGRLLERAELIESAVEAARRLSKETTESGLSQQFYSNSLSSALIEAGRYEAAETLIVDRLMTELQSRSGDRSQQPDLSRILLELAELYLRAGRAEDVRLLLDKAPGWGHADLAGLIKQSGGKAGVIAARALHQLGDNGKARAVLYASLDREANDDDAFALLVELDGQEAIPRLDRLFQRDQFEERPLIWKADLLLEAGQLDQAEKTIRQAISIDPSDGEQGKGDRMRAYDVLSKILAAKGDEAQASQMSAAVKAIRLSENADAFNAAGLHFRAIEMYEKALGFFADAYCIQSRLAIQLNEQGRTEEAMEHYTRAYELMPSSFGRIESHCFGCEGAFTGEVAQGLAEKVFLRLRDESPGNPQVHYLLGYLRAEQDRPEEALASYQKAVELDPNYVNAWKNLLGLASETTLPIALRDRAILRILKLDPLGRHVGHSTEKVADLAALWEVIEENQKMRPEIPDNLYPLPVSEASPQQSYYSRAQSLPTPAEAVAKQEAVESIAQLLGYSSGF